MNELAQRITAIAALATALLVFGCGFMEDPAATYKSRAEAEAAGAISHGWIPEFLPPSATDMKESHNLDTNRSWLRFRFDPADRAAMLAACVPVSAKDVPLPRFDRKRTWWTEGLTEDRHPRREDYTFYRYDEEHGSVSYLAIDKDEPMAWFWRTES